MKPSYFLPFLAVALLIMTMQHTEAMSFPRPAGDITLRGNLNTTCIPHNGGIVYLQTEIITGGSSIRERRPMNIGVVLDRSGHLSLLGRAVRLLERQPHRVDSHPRRAVLLDSEAEPSDAPYVDLPEVDVGRRHIRTSAPR